MKKNIFGYDQQKLISIGLEVDELMLLDYIAHFKNSGKMEEYIIEGEAWCWISWKKISEDMPFLGLKKEAVQRKCLYYLGVKPYNWDERFNNMTESTKKKVKSYKFLGLIEFCTVGEIGSEKTVFKFTDKYYKLIEQEGETCHEGNQATTVKEVQKTVKKPVATSKKNKNGINLAKSTVKVNGKEVDSATLDDETIEALARKKHMKKEASESKSLTSIPKSVNIIDKSTYARKNEPLNNNICSSKENNTTTEENNSDWTW